MTKKKDKDPHAVYLGQLGGNARKRKLTREQRKLLEQLAVVENKDLEDKGLVDKVRDIFG